jgi:hypothetical protein
MIYGITNMLLSLRQYRLVQDRRWQAKPSRDLVSPRMAELSFEHTCLLPNCVAIDRIRRRAMTWFEWETACAVLKNGKNASPGVVR